MSNAVNKYIYLIYIYMYIFLQLQTPSETVFGVVSWGLNTFSEGIGSTRVHIYIYEYTVNKSSPVFTNLRIF